MLEQPYFGQRLRALRLERGMSQAALAAGSMSTGYLSRLESGARPPTARVVNYLAGRLGLPPSAFEATQAPSLAQVLASVTSATDDDDLADQLAEALRNDDSRAPALRWQALWLLARMRSAEGRHEEEHAMLTELVALTDDLPLPVLRARALTRLSRCVRILGDNTQAREYAAEAVDLAAELALPDRAAALHALISAEAEGGRLAEARAHADQLCALTEGAAGTAYTEALWALATVCIRQGSYPEARQALERALDGMDSHEDLALWMRLRLAAASLYLQITPPRTEEARARLDEVGPILDLIGTELHRQETLALRAHLAFAEGRHDDARELCEHVENQGVRLSFRDQVRLEALQGRLRILQGDLEPGVQQLQRLAHLAQDALNVELAAEVWRALAETLAAIPGRTD